MKRIRGHTRVSLTCLVGVDGPRRSARRALLLAGATWPVLAWAGAVFAQSKQPLLIGWLHADSRESGGQYLSAFKEGLAALGWKEGSQVVIEERWANARRERLQPLAEELAARKPAIIVAARSLAVLAAAKAAPRTPIVMDPVEARFAEVASPEEIEPALSRLAKEGAQGLIVTVGPVLRNERARIVKLALAQRWPVVAGTGGWPEAGALISYSADVLAVYRRAAYYVDRILKGAKPADLPIEQPTKFELVLNASTAKALGLTIPPELLVRADKVIE